jgi:hypothetical protein
MATVLVLGRLCDASSEFRLAERFYESSGLADLPSVRLRSRSGATESHGLDPAYPTQPGAT